MPENMQGKGGKARRSPSAHARPPLGKPPLRPAKKVHGGCLRAPPQPPAPAPRPAEPLPSRANFQRGSGGHRDPGDQRRGDGEAPTRRCNRRRGTGKHLAGGSLPWGAGAPAGRCSGTPRPRSAQSLWQGELGGEVLRSSPCVSHRPETGPRGLCPAGAAPTGTTQVAVAAVRKFAAESPDAAADLSPCGVPAKAAGCPSWAREMLLWGGTVPFPVPHYGPKRCAEGGSGDPLRGPPPGGLAPCLRAGSPVRGCWPPRPALRASPGAQTPVPAALSKLSSLLPGACWEAGAGWAGGLGSAGGGPPAPFLARGGGSVPGHGARKTPASHLVLPAREGNFVPAPGPGAAAAGAEGRAGPSAAAAAACGRPCPPHAAGRRRSRAVPRSLWKRFPGCVGAS